MPTNIFRGSSKYTPRTLGQTAAINNAIRGLSNAPVSDIKLIAGGMGGAESSWNTNALNEAGNRYGMFQMSNPLLNQYGVTNNRDAATTARAALQYVDRLRGLTAESPFNIDKQNTSEVALQKYNYGPFQKAFKTSPEYRKLPDETLNYVNRVRQYAEGAEPVFKQHALNINGGKEPGKFMKWYNHYKGTETGSNMLSRFQKETKKIQNKLKKQLN
jgi:membrane-bound lytic murein transglycosylase MltF